MMTLPTSMLIHNREYTLQYPIEQEITPSSRNQLMLLPHMTVMHAKGPQHRDFLQGQLTCDIREVDATHVRQSAFCNVQGRITTLLDVFDWHDLHLVLPRDLYDRTQKLLAKPAMLSRVTLEPKNNYLCFGFYLHQLNDPSPLNWTLPTTPYQGMAYDEGYAYCLDNNAYMLIVHERHYDALVQPFKVKNQWYGSLAWHAARLRSGHVDIYPESSGLFLPHRLNLQQTHRLNFNKGCYKGQEIIARMHYRSTCKHTLMPFHIHTTAPLRTGLKLFAQFNQTEIGEIIDFCPLHANTFIMTASILIEHPSTIYVEDCAEPVLLNTL